MPVYNLTYYQTETGQLLQNPPANPPLYPTQTITDAINKARLYIAGASQCIRGIASLQLAAGQQFASFSAIQTSGAGFGIQGVLNVRQAAYIIGTPPTVFGTPVPQRRMVARSFEYFWNYFLNNANPQPAPFPTTWSQQGQGVNGSFFIDLVSQSVLNFQLDCALYPIDLLSPGDIEAIPSPWAATVPFMAAYWALLSAQSANRQQAADYMFKQYSQFAELSGAMVTPPTNQYIYARQSDPSQVSQLGLGKT